jgi:hypothetical protein
MRLGTVLCDAPSADGGLCGARAVVHEVHYKYSPYANRRPFDVDRVLTEIHYDVDCPRCGYRTQIEKVSEAEQTRSIQRPPSRASQPT